MTPLAGVVILWLLTLTVSVAWRIRDRHDHRLHTVTDEMIRRLMEDQ
jgi:hypothetical protein